VVINFTSPLTCFLKKCPSIVKTDDQWSTGASSENDNLVEEVFMKGMLVVEVTTSAALSVEV
jgi:hypothetical protein